MGTKLYVFCFLTWKNVKPAERGLVMSVAEATIQKKLNGLNISIDAFMFRLRNEGEATSVTPS